jgi:hypothetical protein
MPRVGAGARDRLLQLASELGSVFEIVAHPDDLATQPPYREAVQILAGSAVVLDDVFGYLVGDNATLACAAAEALERRPELVGHEASLTARLDGVSIYARTFLLRTIRRSDDPAVAVSVLLGADGSWGSAMGKDLLRSYLADKLDAEHLRLPETRQRLAGCEPAQVAWLLTLLEAIDAPGAIAAREILGQRSAAGVDLAGLSAFVQVLGPDDFGEPLPCAPQAAALAELKQALHREPPRSLWLVVARIKLSPCPVADAPPPASSA